MGAPPAEGSRAQQPEDDEALPSYSVDPGPSELPGYDEAAASSSTGVPPAPPPPPEKAAAPPPPPPPQPLRSMLDVDDGTSRRYLPEDVLPPAVYILDSTVIYAAADAQKTPLYKLDWKLTEQLQPRTNWIELSRMEPKVADPTQFKPRLMYNLNHCFSFTGADFGESGPSAVLLDFYFLQPTAGPSRKMGSLGFKTTSDHWTALPFAVDEETGVVRPPSRFGRPGGAPLWEVRRVQGAACKWVEARRQGDTRPVGDVAMEYEGREGGELPRLVVTASLTRQKRDALIGLWCLRQWATQQNAAPPPPARNEPRWKSNGLRRQVGIVPLPKKTL